MNFFKLYIGDYQRDTAHLSVTEHGAYLLMLQHLYATERPLPTGKALHRMLRAQDKIERDAIDSVAAQFFTESDGGLFNNRAATEIAKAAHQRTVNQEQGKRGGRPRKTKPDSLDAPEAKTESDTKSITELETESVSESEPIDNPSQTPDTRLLTTANAVVSAPTAPPSLPPCPHGELIVLFGKLLPELPQPRADLWTGTREANLRSRWRWLFTTGKAATTADGLAWFERFFGYVAKSDFLTGRSGKWASCDLGWLVEAKNFAKVVEGNYHDEKVAA